MSRASTSLSNVSPSKHRYLTGLSISNLYHHVVAYYNLSSSAKVCRPTQQQPPGTATATAPAPAPAPAPLIRVDDETPQRRRSLCNDRSAPRWACTTHQGGWACATLYQWRTQDSFSRPPPACQPSYVCIFTGIKLNQVSARSHSQTYYLAIKHLLTGIGILVSNIMHIPVMFATGTVLSHKMH